MMDVVRSSPFTRVTKKLTCPLCGYVSELGLCPGPAKVTPESGLALFSLLACLCLVPLWRLVMKVLIYDLAKQHLVEELKYPPGLSNMRYDKEFAIMVSATTNVV